MQPCRARRDGASGLWRAGLSEQAALAVSSDSESARSRSPRRSRGGAAHAVALEVLSSGDESPSIGAAAAGAIAPASACLGLEGEGGPCAFARGGPGPEGALPSVLSLLGATRRGGLPAAAWQVLRPGRGRGRGGGGAAGRGKENCAPRARADDAELPSEVALATACGCAPCGPQAGAAVACARTAGGPPAPQAGSSGRRQGREPVRGFSFGAAQQEGLPVAASAGGSSIVVEAFVTVAGAHGSRGSVTTPTSMEELQEAVPVSFVPSLLPIAFADHLLRVFMDEARSWHTSKRWLYDKEIESHRLQSGFGFERGGKQGFSRRWEAAGFGDDLRHLRAVIARATQRERALLREAWRPRQGYPAGASAAVATAGQAAGQGVERPVEGLRPLSASELAQETVKLASRGQRLCAESAEWLVRYAHETLREKGHRWEPNYAVGNLYVDAGDFLGAHSDPVESIGPWAIVGSFTLGAARQFRMKPVGTVRAKGPGGGRVTSYSIRLPHNSLLICWEGFQEFWRHEVPKDKGLSAHPIAGPARLNFTFRKTVFSVARRRPLCHCGRKARLKPVLKESSRHRGRYFWACNSPRARPGEYSTCDFFKWDDELLSEQAAGLGGAACAGRAPVARRPEGPAGGPARAPAAAVASGMPPRRPSAAQRAAQHAAGPGGAACAPPPRAPAALRPPAGLAVGPGGAAAAAAVTSSVPARGL
ncbi:unnamed protein product [Prorocentrum cordatum]|uniref:Fe2OG dioxygenase domain-containing protein n=1 Tax=Prorocentrum cordatum TaxID=2364126 RepID=A0ABN9YDQ9_9DINO|nr:unnamed protein product [Polarella glacialis]